MMNRDEKLILLGMGYVFATDFGDVVEKIRERENKPKWIQLESLIVAKLYRMWNFNEFIDEQGDDVKDYILSIFDL